MKITRGMALALTFLLNFAYADGVVKRIMQSPAQQTNLQKFIDEVIIQADGEKTVQALKKAKDTGLLRDIDFFRYLSQHQNDITSSLWNLGKIKALRHQKHVIQGQLAQLKDKIPYIDTYIELGTPGTYIEAFQSVFGLFGEVISINDSESFAGYVQAFSFNPFSKFRPYDQFYPLNNYDPLPVSISSGSVGAISIFGGLHHIPPQKYNRFIESVARVLRPGGVLILREHNTASSDEFDIAYMAHLTFNAFIDESSEQEEQEELRLFAPLDKWTKDLSKVGLIRDTDVEIYQNNDTSRNALLLYRKPAAESSSRGDAQKILITLDEHERPPVNAYLSAPEWYNVDITDAYNDFIVEHPFYEFPFFSGANRFWSIFYSSFKESVKAHGFVDTFFSEYMMMDTFIGIMTTLEFYFKALISLPLKILFADDEKTYRTATIQDPYDVLNDMPQVTVLHRDVETKIVTALIPRHRHLVKILKTLQSKPVTFLNLSNHEEVVLKIRFPKEAPESITKMNSITTLYDYNIPARDAYRYAMIRIKAKNLITTLQALTSQQGELMHVHDF